MNQRMQYNTKQREELLSYLETVKGKHITVNEICTYFQQMEKPIGTTTVYRQLEKLVDEGMVTKYVINGSTPACFEYLGEQAAPSQEHCYHCKCESCGRLIHLHCEEASGMQRHILEQHGFAIDPRRTVFYGLCEACAGKIESSGCTENKKPDQSKQNVKRNVTDA